TDRDFEELSKFVQAAQFDHLGVFSYSDEVTSASFNLDGKVDARTIYNRRRRLLAIQRKISRRRLRVLVGRTFPILVDGPSKETELLWEGRLPGQAAEIDGKTYINDFGGSPPEPGVFGRIRITESSDYDLVGTLDATAATRREQSPAFRVIS